MLKEYKNQVFELLRTSTLGIDSFEITQTDTKTAIQFKNSPFQFIITQNSSSFHSFDYTYVLFAPKIEFVGRYSDEMASFLTEDEYWVPFQDVLNVMRAWIDDDIQAYIKEQNTVDLWKEYQKGDKSFNINAIDFDDKKEFTLDERQQIKLGINELKMLIHKQLETTTEEQAIVNDRLDYLVEASSRLNKFDWKGTAIQTLIAITINLSFDTERGRQLFDLFRRVFAAVPKLIEAAQ